VTSPWVTNGFRAGASAGTLRRMRNVGPTRIDGRDGAPADPAARIDGRDGAPADPAARIDGRDGAPADPAARIDGRGGTRADAAAVAVLLLTGLVIGLPFLRGGVGTYLDNPVHLAEIHSLAHDSARGWSGIAFCGFPLGTLHSPLWFGGLAAAARAGLPATGLYAFCAWLGFCLPPLVLYFVARRSLPVLASAALAYVLLVQKSSIAGISSAFAGMWTFFIAAAALLALIDRLASPGRRTARDLGVIALLTAFTALTHVFVIWAMAGLALIHAAARLRRRSDQGLRRTMAGEWGAMALGLMAAAAYWMPSALARDSLQFFRWDLPPEQFIAVLLLPVDMHGMLLGGRALPATLAYTDALPVLALVAAGVAGGVLAARRVRGGGPAGAGSGREIASLYGAALALLFLTLTLLAESLPAGSLGPVSWRHHYTIRLGLGLAAIPLLVRWSRPAGFTKAASVRPARPAGRRVLLIAAALAAIASGFWWNRPLAERIPRQDDADVRSAGALLEWLRAHADDTWGRVYLQDTFLAPPPGSALFESHLLARTAEKTGVRQLGAYYRLMPFATSAWTKSDQGVLYNRPPVHSGEDLEYLVNRMRASNATHLVTCVPGLGQRLAGTGQFTLLHEIGRFGILHRRQSTSQWSLPLSEGCVIETTQYALGDIELVCRNEVPGASLLVAESYHSFWKLDGPAGARLEPLNGLMRLRELPAGQSRLKLRYEPPRWPAGLSAAAFGLILCLLLFDCGSNSVARPT